MIIGDGVNNDNIHCYLQQITKAQEAERLRIARELHDSTIQSLVTVNHQLERYLAHNQQFDMPHVRFLLSLKGQIVTILQELRHLAQDLRPSILDHLGLIPSIEYLINNLQNNQIETWFRLRGSIIRFRTEVELSIFRVVQEAFNNIIRHSLATKVKIIIAFKKENMVIMIKDNGRGCQDLVQSLDLFIKQGKLGLVGMMERVKLLQGKMKLISLPNRGTVIIFVIPLHSVEKIPRILS